MDTLSRAYERDSKSLRLAAKSMAETALAVSGTLPTIVSIRRTTTPCVVPMFAYRSAFLASADLEN